MATKPTHARTGRREPGSSDVLLEIPVVPGKVRTDENTVGLLCAGGGGAILKEVVVVAEHGHSRRASGACSDHVKKFHLRLIGQKPGEFVVLACDWVGRDQRIEVP